MLFIIIALILIPPAAGIPLLSLCSVGLHSYGIKQETGDYEIWEVKRSPLQLERTIGDGWGRDKTEN